MADDLIPARKEETPAYRFRFGIAYLVLAAVLGVAVGTTVVLVDRGGKTAGPAWSPWKPSAEADGERIRQIANYVSRRYRLDQDRQLVAIVPGPPSIQNGDTRIAIRGVAVRGRLIRSEEDFEFVDTADGLMYILCGGGTSCSIAGRPSNERGQLVRREALELALYTFKYVNGVDSIIAFPPPPTGSDTTHALFFEKSDFQEQLERPLYETLAPVKRVDASSLDTLERRLVDRLTLPHFFSAQPTAAPDGSAILVLDPAVLGS